MRTATLWGLVLAAGLSGCVTGGVTYSPPSVGASTNSITLNKSRDEVWGALIPALGKRFFVINNLDKGSGLVNLSYTGNPQAYVDCGYIVSTVNNMRGERTYSFSGASADESYEMTAQNRLFFIRRTLKLEGRVNLIVEEVGPKQTRVSANTRYLLNRDLQVAMAGGPPPVNRHDSIAFNTGEMGSFPRDAEGRGLECRPTGNLETELLSLVK